MIWNRLIHPGKSTRKRSAREYLRRIQVENAFCIRFAPQYVHRLLCALTPDYANIPMNLFEPVLLAALGMLDKVFLIPVYE